MNDEGTKKDKIISLVKKLPRHVGKGGYTAP